MAASRYRCVVTGTRSINLTHTLSELASREILAGFGLPIAREIVAKDVSEACLAAKEIGYPVAIKLNGDQIAHKTERGLVRLGIESDSSARLASDELLSLARPDDGTVSLIVSPMIKGNRELILGALHDELFGPTVMLGIGGVMAEAFEDVTFRPIPISEPDALSMIRSLRGQKLLGSFRGEAPVNESRIVTSLIALSQAMVNDPQIASIDVNPMIVQSDGEPIAVDALVEVFNNNQSESGGPVLSDIADSRFRALFDPRGVVVAGASSHPGKFGFVSLHNILANGYQGAIAATNLNEERILDIQTVKAIDDLPDDKFDLAFVCTPASTNQDLLRACARKGISAVFITSAGYREAGDEGRLAEDELVALARELDILLAGPNGQGVVSTPSKLCAQIVAPYPPKGSIAVASQSGNFVSSFQNYARQFDIGISRAVSAGNAASVSVIDYLRWFANDEATSVSLAYLEGISNGAEVIDGFREAATKKPLVVVKGGSTSGGARAAASHTGALAANDRVFDGVCRQTGVTRATSIEEAFEIAATFATQPLPLGPNVVVLTTVGGWGVMTSDTIAREGILNLLSLPDDLRALIDQKLPPRWSKNNPVDCAGGETRDTIPEVMEILANHPSVHSIVYLGIGIQSNQARLMRDGGFFPNYGMDRIVPYHEAQDKRFAQAAFELSRAFNKPILTATELAYADPDNIGPRTVRQTGRVCYSSGNRAATALGHLYQYSKFRGLA